MADITQILSQIESGDPSAAAELLPLVYDEVRKLAAANRASENPGQTLKATALEYEMDVRSTRTEIRSD
jgi:ECF sigma factor